ncbi:coenzyme F420-0:L-glutamate ligase [Methanimicrococcus stummii]|uniref:coenzyme F420-0:L-glutamate ligase n=1 Tax=Methanimicrococcus stummii TaxID=3028294 RepID=UPI003B9685B3
MIILKLTGTQSIGIKAPIVKEGDDLASIVTNSVLEAAESSGFEIEDGDVIGVTEAVVARTQGNYATVEQLAKDVRSKFPGGVAAVLFPILSRNRFAIMLKGIAMGLDKVYLILSYPSDEVGNQIITWEQIDEAGINPYKDVLTEEEFRKAFGEDTKHLWTGVDYIEYYKSLGDNIEVIFANHSRAALQFTNHVLTADIHTRHRTKKTLKAAGAETVYGLDDLLSAPVDGSGCNPDFGILGANKATEDRIKLFPKDCNVFVNDVQKQMKERTGKQVEVLVYGDGAFKDPVAGIWELADPVVSPGYTKGLEGTPNELKLKYLADNEFKDLEGDELQDALRESIKNKEDVAGKMVSQGTTPRRYVDLIGSLCDLTSGSGDKGTPIILVKNYFDNYATE